MAEDKSPFGLPGSPVGIGRLSVTFARLGERLTGKHQPILETVGRQVQPVLQVGLPDFSDAERPLYMSGGEVGATGQFASVGLVSSVSIAVFGVTAFGIQGASVIGSRFAIFTPEPGYNPFANNTGTAVPDVRPNEQDSIGQTQTFLGTNPLPSMRQGCIYPTGKDSGFAINFLSPLILPPDVAIVCQQTLAGFLTQAHFTYREFA